MPSAVIALFGPTGVGKTAVAIALAERLRTCGEDPVAVSADALQVYRGLETLTGVASSAEQAALEHRLVSIIAPRESFSAGRYAALAHAEIDELLEAGRRPIVVGGTGLYLRAALTDLDLRPPPDPGIRARLQRALDVRGAAAMHAELVARAPTAAARIAPTDSHRVVRALELLEGGRVPTEDRAGASELWTKKTRQPTLLVGLAMGRAALDARIEARIDEMLAAGAAEEVRAVAAAPGGIGASAAKALGYRELLAGDEPAMRRRTRQYARRQLTWMRKLAGATVIDVTARSPDDVAGEIVSAWGSI